MKQVRGWFVLTCLASLLVMIAPASAAGLTARSDIMSRQQISVGSNHEIRFTTPTGVDASSDTITLTFSPDFSLGSVAFGDIDLFHGAGTGFETSETLAASAAAGVWGVSISGQTITLTAPTDAAIGEITAGQKVIVRIGTNAAGGVNQITNPSIPGLYTLSIAGTFGDSGGMTLPIIANDTVNVSATVATTTVVPPPPGGGGGKDATPPIISNVQVQNVTTTSADITWNTDELADSRVDYGQDATYASGTVSDANLTLSHTISLTGLEPDTVYHFRVISRDGSSNSASSGDFSFRTAALAPHAPIISNLRVSSITDTSAIVLWDTDIPATSLVDYGTTAGYGQTASSPGTVTSHSVSLTGLLPNTVYHFRVTSDANGLASQSSDQTFQTLSDTTPPANVSDFTATPGDQQVMLTWTNPPDPDFSYVRILARTDQFPSNPNDGRLVYQGPGNAVTENGLINGTTYYYTNYAFDANGNFSSGALAQATPSAAPPPPPVVPPPPTPPPGVQGGGTTSVPPVPPPVVPPTSTTTAPLLPISPEFYGAGGTVELSVDNTGQFGAVAGQSILVRVPVIGLGSIPDRGTVMVGNALYALTPTPSGDAWAATIIPAVVPGNVSIIVSMHFTNGATAIARFIAAVQGRGRVLEAVLIGTPSEPVSGAIIRLYEQHNGALVLWAGGPSGQANPVVTGADGSYVFIVPNGTYQLQVSKEGYADTVQDITVTHNVIAIDLILRKLPQKIEEVIKPELPVIANVQAVLEQSSLVIQAILDTVRSPEAQVVAQNVLAPTLLTVGLANIATAVSAFNLFNYLRFLITQPILLFGRRRRKQWGFVYNALTKQPIDLAILRLIHADKRIVLQTRISNSQGQFAFEVRPGRYRIEVIKPNYTFPSFYLKDQKEDIDLLDLYHGEIIEVASETALTPNIPLDPVAFEETPRRVLFKKLLRQVQQVASWLSLLLTLVALIISPSLLLAMFMLFQIGMFLAFRRLALPPKPKEWGIVYDHATGRPLERAVVRVFHKKFNKLLETQVTDKSGKYGFFVGKDVYYVTAESPEYEKYQTTDLNYAGKKEAVIDEKIPLSKKPDSVDK